ncbi:MAG: helix-turn-helix transcriptional regulator, partial [Ruminococcus sp.]|nr:helix-turn-helix transcriptional regulator [Ruminococcus sp.]
MSFGKRLQGYRKEKGLSQEALANQLYVTRQSISQWENDKTMPSVDLLLKISEIFGVTVD